MPTGVRARVEQSAEVFESSPTVELPRELRQLDARDGDVGGSIPFVAFAGWLAAAAAVVLAVSGWALFLGRSGGAPASPEAAREAMIAQGEDVKRGTWQDWDDPEIKGVEGDVVWSEEEQRGYLRFTNLPVNDPTEEQYQLWIIDSRGLVDEDGQSARISGAIFNAETGETIVPIEPGIPTEGAVAVAVTIKEPGGVWASDMSRRVVISKLDG